MLEGFRWEVTVNDRCRPGGIKPHSYFSWTNDPSTGSQQDSWRPPRRGYAGDTLRDATQQEVQQLKHPLADLSLEGVPS